MSDADRLLERVIEACDRPIIGLAGSGEIDRWSRAATAWLGYPPGEAIGRPVSLIVGPDGPTAAAILELAAGDTATGHDVTLRSREGTPLPCELTAVARGDGGTWLIFGGIEDGAVTALRESEARYRALVETSPDAIVVHSGGKVVYINRTGLKMAGADSPDQLMGREALDFIHPEFVALAAERIRQAYVEGARNPLVEQKMVDLEGRVRDVEVMATPITYDGAPANQVVVRDITARKEAEAQLRLLSSVVEQSSEGIAVADLDGKLLFSNDAHAAMHGYRADELVGRHLSILHGPEHMAAVDAANQQIKTTGQFKGEIWHRRRDGSNFPTIMHNSLLHDDKGEPIGLIATVRDMTDQWAAEQALRESEERYRHLVEVSPDPVVVLQDNYCRFVNTAFTEVFGYTQEDVDAGLGFYRLVSEDDREAIESRRRARMRGDPLPKIFRLEMIARDGRAIPCEISAALIQHQGRPAALTVIRDVTERERAENERLTLLDQVLETQKLESLGVLACGIAHDFNNLLVGVLTNAGLARRRLSEKEPARGQIENIELAAQRAAELCNQLLSYSGRAEVTVEEVDVTAVVEEMIELLRVPLSGRVTLDLELDHELPRVLADVTQLRQVLMNLITNAAEAIGGGSGTVSVRTSQVDGRSSRLATPLRPIPYVCIEVADDGAGMDEATRKRVFDPFFTTKVSGRGLGLATVLGFVRTHSGAIDLDSQPDRGSQFRVFLPTAQALVERPVAPVEEPLEAVAGTVLVVDDEELVRNVVIEVLEQEGLEVLGAAGGAEALEIFVERWRDIGLVIIDMTMPGMNGDELFRRVRDVDPRARVLFSSGYHEGRLGTLLASDAGVSFIRKPFRVDELIERVRLALA